MFMQNLLQDSSLIKTRVPSQLRETLATPAGCPKFSKCLLCERSRNYFCNI